MIRPDPKSNNYRKRRAFFEIYRRDVSFSLSGCSLINHDGSFRVNFGESFDSALHPYITVKHKENLKKKTLLKRKKGILWIRDLSINTNVDGIALVCDGAIVDYVAFGSKGNGPSGGLHDAAVVSKMWSGLNGLVELVPEPKDLGGGYEPRWYQGGDSIGRDKDSTDTNGPNDWSYPGGKNARSATPSSRNMDHSASPVINEILYWPRPGSRLQNKRRVFIEIFREDTSYGLFGCTLVNHDGSFRVDFDETFDSISHRYFTIKQRRTLKTEVKLWRRSGIFWMRDIAIEKIDAIGLFCDGELLDYVSWGNDGDFWNGTLHNNAVASGIWSSTDDYVEVAELKKGDSLGRDVESRNTKDSADWSNQEATPSKENSLPPPPATSSTTSSTTSTTAVLSEPPSESPLPTTLPMEPTRGSGLKESVCEVKRCCEEECCSRGTVYDESSGTCVLFTVSRGYKGEHLYPGYAPGCLTRSCCDEMCCGEGTIYDPGTAFCIFEDTSTEPTPSPSTAMPSSGLPTVRDICEEQVAEHFLTYPFSYIPRYSFGPFGDLNEVEHQINFESAKAYWQFYDSNGEERGLVDAFNDKYPGYFNSIPSSNGLLSEVRPFEDGYLIFRDIYRHRLQLDPSSPVLDIYDLVDKDPVIQERFRHWTLFKEIYTDEEHDIEAHRNHKKMMPPVVVDSNDEPIGREDVAEDFNVLGVPLLTDTCLVSLTPSNKATSKKIVGSSIGLRPIPKDAQLAHDRIVERATKLTGFDNLYVDDGWMFGPGFDCDDYADAIGVYIIKGKKKWKGYRVGVSWTKNIGPNAGKTASHSVTRIDDGKYYWLVDAQSGAVIGPWKRGVAMDAAQLIRGNYEGATNAAITTYQEVSYLNTRDHIAEPSSWVYSDKMKKHFRKVTGFNPEDFTSNLAGNFPK